MAILVDGRIYGTPEEAPDLGSLEAVSVEGEDGNIRAGTTKVYKFNKSTDTWYEL